MQLDLADGVAVRCRNIFQKGSIFGGAAGVVNLPRPAQFDLALDHRPDWRDTDSARDENRMRRAFLERTMVRRPGDGKPVADPHLLMHELPSAAAAQVEVDRNHIAIELPLRIDKRIASPQSIAETDAEVR